MSGAVQLATSAFGLVQSRKDSRDVRRQSAEEARLERRATDERVRNLQREEGVTLGRQRSQFASANVDVNKSRSVLEIQDETIREFERERAFVREVGASRAALTEARGRTLSRQVKTQGVIGFVQGAQSAFGLAKDNGGFFKF